MSEDELLALLKDTEILNQIKEVEEIYQELNLKEDKFCNTFNIHCKKNCGSCCEHFLPDITQMEAIYLAYGIIKNGKEEEILQLLEERKDYNFCPLYDKEKFCTVYPYRPMICRLFNAVASSNKKGEPVFRRCKWNDTGVQVSTEEFLNQKDAVVTMNDYSQRLEGLEVGANKTELLPIALKKAIYKIELILQLKEEENKY